MVHVDEETEKRPGWDWVSRMCMVLSGERQVCGSNILFNRNKYYGLVVRVISTDVVLLYYFYNMLPTRVQIYLAGK